MKVLPHKHNFSAAMHGWGIFPNNKSSSKLEKNMCKTDLFYQNKHDHQFFLQILVKFLRNSIKYVVSRAVPSAHSGALLRVMAIQSAFSDDSFK